MFRHLLFDLDNTLYPSSSAMDKGITCRMLSFVAEFLGISYEAAVQRRTSRLPYYGTTLEWLKTEEGFTDTESYFRAVHPEGEEIEVPEDPLLRPFLESIVLPKSILTNSPREHADRVLKKLHIEDLFMTVTDIRACDLKGKPYAGSYYKALEMSGSTLSETLFLDDHQKYVKGFAAIGGTAVLVGESEKYQMTEYSERVHCVPSIYDIKSLLK